MRVLTIIDHLGMGGRQRTAQNYAIGYKKHGHVSAVLAVEGGGPREAEIIRAGIPTFVGTKEGPPIDVAAAWRPDIIHVHSEGPFKPHIAAALEQLLIASNRRVPILETSSFGKVDYRRVETPTDIHLLKSRWALWRWQRWTRPFTPRRIGVVVPNAVDTNSFFPVTGEERTAFRKRAGIPEDAFLFGCIARPDPVKWPPLIFQAFEAVAQKHPSAHLLVAGLINEARERISRFPNDIRRRVIELPLFTADDPLRICYGSLDVFLHASSIGETFGLVFIEAMACETPVITVSTPAKNNSQIEVVGHQRGGLIANDYGSMAEAMELLMRDELLCRRLAIQGAQFVRSNFTIDQIIPTLERISAYALENTDRSTLYAAVESDPSLVTHVADAYIEKLMYTTLGRPSWTQRLLKRMVHRPLIFRIWRAIKYREY